MPVFGPGGASTKMGQRIGTLQIANWLLSSGPRGTGQPRQLLDPVREGVQALENAGLVHRTELGGGSSYLQATGLGRLPWPRDPSGSTWLCQADFRVLQPAGQPCALRGSRLDRLAQRARRAGRILVMMKPARAVTRRYLPGSPFNTPRATPPVKQFAMQDLVTHDRYGLGRVISVEETAVLVDFGTAQERISTPYAKMTRL
jgi:hypothetical protein